MRYFATAYYPEYWGHERVRTDAGLMRDAGINVVRIGEFAWSHLEPQEGDYRTDWLENALDVFEEYGIKVVLCTPTAAAPPWLVEKHPEILMVNKEGRSAWLGVRQHTCYTSPVYRRYAQIIVGKLCEVAARHTNILGWQIDNEIGHSIFGLCHCEACQQGFRHWLKNRYQTPDVLNEAWGNTFWSARYSEWKEIRLGDLGMTQSSSHVLDSLRFHSDQRIAYLRAQSNLIRERLPDAVMTTNSMAGSSNRHEAYQWMDCTGVDVYPLSDRFSKSAFLVDLFRSFRKESPLWVLETGVGGQGYAGAPHNRRLRATYWCFIARGAEMVTLFRWRTCLSGYEKDLMGVLGHSGVPRKRYQAVKECIAEITSHAPLLQQLPKPKAIAGLVFDHENHWASSSGHWSLWAGYEKTQHGLHEQLTKSGITVDVIPAEADLTAYGIVLVPAMLHVRAEFAGKLEAYVKAGGVLIMLGMTGICTANAVHLPRPGPEHLSDLLGLSIEGQLVVVESADHEPVCITGCLGSGTAHSWLADIELKDGTVLAAFDNSGLQGQAAIVEKRSGKGIAFYVGASRIDDQSLTQLLNHAFRQGGLSMPPALPPCIERVERGAVTFFINHSDETVSFPWEHAATARIGSFVNGVVTLESYGVCLLETDAFSPR